MNVFHVMFQIFNIIVSVCLFLISVFLPHFGVVLPENIDPILFGVVISAIFYLSLSRISQILELSQRISEIESSINNNVSDKVSSVKEHFDAGMRSLRDNVISLTDDKVIPMILEGMELHPITQHRDAIEKGFSIGQTRIKNAVRRDLLNRQSLRLVHLEYNDWTHIYDFSVIHTILYAHTFSGRLDDYRKNVVRDYTVSWNADRVFGQYSFERYFKKVIEHRESDRNCTTRIRFLIFVDYDGPITGHSSEFSTIDAAIQLERSMLGIFEIYKNKYMQSKRDSEKTPQLLYKDMFHGGHFFTLRILTQSAFQKLSGIKMNLIEQPFNVYSDYCVSKSRVRNLEDDPPIPHLEIAINSVMVNEYTDTFDRLWESAFSIEDEIFDENDKWESFGRGDFVRRWSAVRSDENDSEDS